MLREEHARCRALQRRGARSCSTATLADLEAPRAPAKAQRLAELIAQRCATLEAAGRAGARAAAGSARARAQPRSRSASRELGAEINRERLEQEIVLLLQRMDVAEELDRLAATSRRRARCRRPGAAGRRLDFLMQEFNREANTLSSKSQDLDTTRAAVDMKVLIEQMREQVQNIE